MVKRESVKAIEEQKIHMISALYGNSAFDESDEGLRERANRIKKLEEHFTKAIELVYNPELHKEKEIDWNNPFWAAAKRSYDRKLEQLRGVRPDVSVREVVSQQEPQPRRQYDQMP